MGIFDMITSFLNPQQGYEDAEEEMRKQWEQAQAAQEPFRKAGENQLPALTGAENALLDPTKLLGDWMSKYEESPWAKYAMGRAKQSGLEGASSMGLMGSSAALNNIQQGASDISQADRQNFLNDLMQKYMAGIGIGQNIYNTGAGTAQNLGNQGVKMGQNLGEMAFGKANAPGNLLENLIKMGASIYTGVPMMGGQNSSGMGRNSFKDQYG